MTSAPGPTFASSGMLDTFRSDSGGTASHEVDSINVR